MKVSSVKVHPYRVFVAVLVALSGALAGCSDPSPPLSVTATGTPTAGPVAAAMLETLPVKGRAPLTGYSRSAFMPHGWADPDRNGCDARRDALARQAVIATTAGPHHCVLAATVHDPYSDTDLPSTRIDIDHVVALGDAWQTGAFDERAWTAARREQFANDPANLLAVSASLNRGKGDRNAASWLPPTRAYRCAYVARQITIKLRYGLWVTPPERDTMAAVLTTCPEQTVVARLGLRY